MKRVCTTCNCIIEADWIKGCPQCGGTLEPYNPAIHVNYSEMDVDPDYETAKSWSSD